MGKVVEIEFAKVPPDPDIRTRFQAVGFPETDLEPGILIVDHYELGWSLYVFNRTGGFLGDTLHPSRSKAIRDAQETFSVDPSAWQSLKFKSPVEFNVAVRQVVARTT